MAVIKSQEFDDFNQLNNFCFHSKARIHLVFKRFKIQKIYLMEHALHGSSPSPHISSTT